MNVNNNNSSSGSGGGIYLTNSSINILESTIRDNSALKQGGGVFIENGSSFNAEFDVTVSWNNTTQDCFTGTRFSRCRVLC